MEPPFFADKEYEQIPSFMLFFKASLSCTKLYRQLCSSRELLDDDRGRLSVRNRVELLVLLLVY